MSDVADIIDDFAVPFVIKRRGQGTVVAGRMTQAASADVPASGTITPATSKDLMRLPEGRRTEVVKRIITKDELLLLPQADVIVYGGRSYEAEHVDEWDGFYDCLATEVRA